MSACVQAWSVNMIMYFIHMQLCTLGMGSHSRQPEKKKDQQVVDKLMSCSFAMRRNEILAKSFDLHDLFEKFPFLQESGQVWKLFCYTLIRDVNLEALHMYRSCYD